MTLYKNKYRIESARLKGWNYSSSGAYFVTICTKNRMPYFGEIIDGEMVLSDHGKTARKYWQPNHVHGIISIVETRVVKTPNLGVFTMDIIPVWQPRFHDHIIRDENELNKIRQYIMDNPVNWKKESNHE